MMFQGGFLFTTAASCLSWPSTVNGHWSASALFYASILISIVGVVMSSQQLLALPNRAIDTFHEKAVVASTLSQQSVPQPLTTSDSQLADKEKQDLDEIVDRLCTTYHTGEPNRLHVYALQVPIMLLTMATFAFFAGVCSVVFAPLAKHLAWDDNAKVCQQSTCLYTHHGLTFDRLLCSLV